MQLCTNSSPDAAEPQQIFLWRRLIRNWVMWGVICLSPPRGIGARTEHTQQRHGILIAPKSVPWLFVCRRLLSVCAHHFTVFDSAGCRHHLPAPPPARTETLKYVTSSSTLAQKSDITPAPGENSSLSIDITPHVVARRQWSQHWLLWQLHFTLKSSSWPLWFTMVDMNVCVRVCVSGRRDIALCCSRTYILHTHNNQHLNSKQWQQTRVGS